MANHSCDVQSVCSYSWMSLCVYILDCVLIVVLCCVVCVLCCVVCLCCVCVCCVVSCVVLCVCVLCSSTLLCFDSDCRENRTVVCLSSSGASVSSSYCTTSPPPSVVTCHIGRDQCVAVWENSTYEICTTECVQSLTRQCRLSNGMFVLPTYCPIMSATTPVVCGNGNCPRRK